MSDLRNILLTLNKADVTSVMIFAATCSNMNRLVSDTSSVTSRLVWPPTRISAGLAGTVCQFDCLQFQTWRQHQKHKTQHTDWQDSSDWLFYHSCRGPNSWRDIPQIWGPNPGVTARACVEASWMSVGHWGTGALQNSHSAEVIVTTMLSLQTWNPAKLFW